jgi:TolB-like protein/Flp pilus assembly protein TadD
VYLAASWGLIEFTDWSIERFGLETSLVTGVFVVLAVLLPFVLWGAWKLGDPQQPNENEQEAPARSVAVLPFTHLGGDADTEYLSEGIADQILTDLARIGDLKVVARTSSFAYKDAHEDVRTVGRRLGARAVLEGGVQRSGDRLRVTTQLINVADGYHLWTEQYDRDVEDIFKIEDEIAENVARVLNAILHDRERLALTKVPTQDVRAYEFYLRGRQFFFQTRRKNLEYARGMFLRAIELDDKFALAYAAVADTAALMGMYYPGAEAHLAEAERAARRALELDPDLAEAHSARGAVLFASGRLEEAEPSFLRAAELDPRLFEARYFHARACYQGGRFEDAVRLFREASDLREDYSSTFFVAQSLEVLGRHDEAQAAYREALAVTERYMDLNPDDPRAASMRAVSLCRIGRAREGLSWAERALTIDPEDGSVLYNVACLFSLAGHTERALECLLDAEAVGFGNVNWLKKDPDLDKIREDPRFSELLVRMERRQLA